MNELPLYPNEALLWDENLVPLGQFYGGKVMALPKLNLQFLTSHDYLLRSVVRYTWYHSEGKGKERWGVAP